MTALAERFEGVHAGAALAKVARDRTSTRLIFPQVREFEAHFSSLAEFAVGQQMWLLTAPIFPQITPVRSEFLRAMDRVQQSLERLQDGWNGDGSIAPTPEAVSQLQMVVGIIPPTAKVPDVEIDDESGSVTLRWTALDSPTVFSFIAGSKSGLLAVKTTVDEQTKVSSRRFGNAEPALIARHIEDDRDVATVLGIA